MATNVYFSQKVKSEHNLYEDIAIEALKMYGQDVYYLPRDLVNEDKILGEDVPSTFDSGYKLEMYIENTEGFEGEGDLFTKFGVEIRDTATFIVARRRWLHTVQRHDNEVVSIRPLEGDLIYLPMSQSLFQIMHVEHEQPFYQLKNLPTYKLRCEIFEYAGEDLDTGIGTVDKLETSSAYTYNLTLDSASNDFSVGATVTQTFSDGVIMSGEVSKWNDSDKILSIIHAGASDGLYHAWTTLKLVSAADGSVATVTAIGEDNKLSENEANSFYETTGDDMGFLDFSEGNPFGDVQ